MRLLGGSSCAFTNYPKTQPAGLTFCEAPVFVLCCCVCQKTAVVFFGRRAPCVLSCVAPCASFLCVCQKLLLLFSRTLLFDVRAAMRVWSRAALYICVSKRRLAVSSQTQWCVSYVSASQVPPTQPSCLRMGLCLDARVLGSRQPRGGRHVGLLLPGAATPQSSTSTRVHTTRTPQPTSVKPTRAVRHATARLQSFGINLWQTTSCQAAQ